MTAEILQFEAAQRSEAGLHCDISHGVRGWWKPAGFFTNAPRSLA